MTATPITSKQNKQFKRFVEDASDRALKDAALDKDGLQMLLGNGGKFQAHVLEGVRKYSSTGPVFPVYLQTEVGGKSRDKLLAELQSGGYFVYDWAIDIMSKPDWNPGKKEVVKFSRVKVSDLGFTKNPTTAEIWARIKELGHSLCEPCDGPAIRLALKDQPRSDYFWVAMQQITDSDGDPRVFLVLRHYGGGDRPWLHASWVRPGLGWPLNYEVVFRLRK